jgi:MFS family permease
MVSVFFAAFAFFGAILFVPRWFQVVKGLSPTDSGLALLPLMAGLIVSSVISGLIVSRTGRYKWLIVGSIIVMGFGVLLMTQLTKDTPVPVLWVWMLIAGLGVGTTFSVPTIVIQNAVPFKELGVATSNLTFFRQIGGTIALAFVGTIFGSAFADQLVPQLLANGVPQSLISGMQQAGAGFDIGQLTGVGDLATNLAAIIPPQFQSLIPNIIEGIHAAFSLATAQTFWLSVAGSIVAALAAVAIKEIPLRSVNSAPVPAAEQAGVGAPVSAATKTDAPAPKLPVTE